MSAIDFDERSRLVFSAVSVDEPDTTQNFEDTLRIVDVPECAQIMRWALTSRQYQRLRHRVLRDSGELESRYRYGIGYIFFADQGIWVPPSPVHHIGAMFFERDSVVTYYISEGSDSVHVRYQANLSLDSLLSNVKTFLLSYNTDVDDGGEENVFMNVITPDNRQTAFLTYMGAMDPSHYRSWSKMRLIASTNWIAAKFIELTGLVLRKNGDAH